MTELDAKARKKLLAAILERQRRLVFEKSLYQRRQLQAELKSYRRSAAYYGIEIPKDNTDGKSE